MLFTIANDPASLAVYLRDFLILADGNRFRKRVVQLARDLLDSPPQAKIVAHYHWLELALGEQIVPHESRAQLPDSPVSLGSFGAMCFAATMVETHARLTALGRKALQGRIRAALQAETGFAALYLEMDVAQRLLEEGYNIDFPDLEGTARYDLYFTNGAVEGEVECKSLSTDAGRKIHRKDFYRFIHAIGPGLAQRAAAGLNEILLITLDDRLPGNTRQQAELRSATLHFISDDSLNNTAGSYFNIARKHCSEILRPGKYAGEREFYAACCDTFGKDIHVSGALTDIGASLVVMRSRQEDDHSKPWLEATQKAAAQLSGTRPGIIAVQFDDLEPSDLMLPHLRRRAEILSGALFRRDESTHVSSNFFTIYGGLVRSDGGIAAPAFAIMNPRAKFAIKAEQSWPHLPDDEFARLIGAIAPTAACHES
jgi:hypothetical protein